MSAPTHNATVVADGLGRLTSMYANQPNVRAILTALLTVRQELEDVAFAVYQGRRLRSATLYALPLTNAVLDALGALVGQGRNGASDAQYQAVLFLRVAVKNSTGRIGDWSNFASILLQTSGGGVAFLEGKAAFDFAVFNMTLPAATVAATLALAVPNGVRGAFVFSTWDPSLSFVWGSTHTVSIGTGGLGSVHDSTVGLKLVSARSIS